MSDAETVTLEELFQDMEIMAPTAVEEETVVEPQPVETIQEPVQEDQAPTTEINTEPVFFEEKKDDDIELTDEDLENLNELIEEYDVQIKELSEAKDQKEQELSSVLSEKEQLEAQLREKDEIINQIESAWSKVQDTPVVGQLVRDVIEGKEVNIPEMLREKIDEQFAALPNLGDVQSEGAPEPKRGGLAESLQSVSTWGV